MNSELLQALDMLEKEKEISKDILFAGFTPYYTCVTWGGFDDNMSQSDHDTRYAKNLWRAIMSRLHEGLEYREFQQPEGLTTATVCRKSGKLAVGGLCDADPRGSMITSEYFALCLINI